MQSNTESTSQSTEPVNGAMQAPNESTSQKGEVAWIYVTQRIDNISREIGSLRSAIEGTKEDVRKSRGQIIASLFTMVATGAAVVGIFGVTKLDDLIQSSLGKPIAEAQLSINDSTRRMKDSSTVLDNIRLKMTELSSKAESADQIIGKLSSSVNTRLDELVASVNGVEKALRAGSSLDFSDKLSESNNVSESSDPTSLRIRIDHAIKIGDIPTLRKLVPKWFAYSDFLSARELAQLAWAALKMLDYQTAIAATTKGILKSENGNDISDDDKRILSRLYSKRGTAYIELNNLRLALSDLSRAVELDQKNDEALNNRAELMLSCGMYELATNDLRKSIDIDSSDYRGYNNLTLTYLEWASETSDIGKKNEILSQAEPIALEGFKKTDSSGRGRSEIGDSALILAMTYAMLDNNQQARSWLARAYDLSPPLKTLIERGGKDSMNTLHELVSTKTRRNSKDCS